MPAHTRSRKKPVPRFASEDEERDFWATHDATDYVDWRRARRVAFPNLRPSTTTISLRLPATLLEELKALANERDVPYQSLLKVFLAERLERERRGRRRPPVGARDATRNRDLESRERLRAARRPPKSGAP